MPRDLKSPVWDIHDEYRTVRLNVKYYESLLSRTERCNFVVEFMLAATASGSGLAALSYLQSGVGKDVWGGLTACAAVLAVAKPLFKWTERIKHLEGLAAGYRLLDHGYRQLEVTLNEENTCSESSRQRFHSLLEQAAALDAKYPPLPLDRRLRARLSGEVDTELPSSRFFVPEVLRHDNDQGKTS